MIRILVVAAVLALACASPDPRPPAPGTPAPRPAVKPPLPDYAVPQGGILDPAKIDTSDLISYRALTRKDFKATRPPAHLARYADKVGAATCAYIHTTKDTQLMLQPTRSQSGKILYTATAHRLRFHAQMDRNCSWWNPTSVGFSDTYLLQHEQIHFALFELEARALNASAPAISARLNATSDDPEKAAAVARHQLEGQLQTALDDVLARSRKFDEDTSMGHYPEKQQQWWERVSAELSERAAR